jgi:hypothetical protein
MRDKVHSLIGIRIHIHSYSLILDYPLGDLSFDLMAKGAWTRSRNLFWS